MDFLIPHPCIQDLSSADISSWVRATLFDKQRTIPIVAVTSLKGSGKFPLPLSDIKAMVGGRALIVVIETGSATRALAEALPPHFGVYGGALRIWLPGIRVDSNCRDHPLLILDAYSTTLQKQEVLTAVGRKLERRAGRGEPVHSVEPIMASRPPWELLGQHLKVGNVVEARVVKIASDHALLDLIPGARGKCHLSEIDLNFVPDIAQFLEVDEIVRVKILTLDPERERAELSIKQAFLDTETAPLPSLVPSGLPFSWERNTSLTTPVETPPKIAAAATRELATCGECSKLRTQIKQLKEKLDKERGAEDRLRKMKKRFSLDCAPFESERAFLQAVRVEYARTIGESDRQTILLDKMRVGPDFLKNCLELDGIDQKKIIQVCAEVATGRARESGSRNLHPFLEGGAASKQRSGKRDGAKAWRCALQVGTPSARRLMYWVVPGGETKIIEFANVCTHDDMRITEG